MTDQDDCTCKNYCRACDLEYEGERCTCQDDCPVHGAYNSEARLQVALERNAEADRHG